MTAIIYRGKYPHNIESRWGTKGEYYVRTNNGRIYRVHVVNGQLPDVGSDINSWSAFELVGQSDKRRGAN